MPSIWQSLFSFFICITVNPPEANIVKLLLLKSDGFPPVH